MTKQESIEYAKRQFVIFQTRALYCQAVALIDKAVAKHSLEVMKRWIEHMSDCNDTIAKMQDTEGDQS
jgi:hypothetical protein